MANNEVQVRVSADNSAAVSGLKQTQNAVSDFKKQAESSFASLGSRFSAIFAAAGAALGLKAIADDMGAIADKAGQLGASAEEIQRLAYAGDQAGTSIDTISKALVKANANTIAAIGGNEELNTAFASFGINAKDFVDLSLEEKLLAVAEGFQRGGSDAEKLDALMKLLGKSAVELVPLLSQGPEALSASLKDAAVVSGEAVARIDAAGDRINAVWGKAKAAGIEFLDSIVRGFQRVYIWIGTVATYLGNLPDGFKAAKEAAADFKRGADLWMNETPESKKGAATDTEALEAQSAVAKEAAKEQQKAEDDFAKLKAENDRKAEEARLKTISLKERELELTKAIARIEAEKKDRGGYMDPVRAEELRGKMLDLNKELGENREEQKREADKAADDEKKRLEKATKDAEKAAKDKAKAEKDAKKDALQTRIEGDEKKLSGLEKNNPSFTVDSLRSIGGGLAGVNYGAALSKADKQSQAIEIAKQQLETDRAILRQLEKSDRTDLGDGSFPAS